MEIPVIDFKLLHNEQVQQRIREACKEWGFFQVINHGLSRDLLTKSLHCCNHFFNLPLDEKLDVSHPPLGFVHKSKRGHVLETKQHFFMFGINNTNFERNIWPRNPPDFRDIMEQLLKELQVEGGEILKGVAESLGIPSFEELYKGKGDALLANFCPSSIAKGENAIAGHKDNCVATLLFQQNDVPGLQVLKDEQWIPINPLPGALIFNLGDVIQVWTNGRYKSPSHRVISNEVNRHSLAFFMTTALECTIVPLPTFTSEAGQAPIYRPFIMSEYYQARMKVCLDTVATVDDYRI